MSQKSPFQCSGPASVPYRTVPLAPMISRVSPLFLPCVAYFNHRGTTLHALSQHACLRRMDAPTDSSIDDLAAHATVRTYGDIRCVMPRDGPPTKTQLAGLMPAFGGQYHRDPRCRDTLRVRANRSVQESRVRTRTNPGNSRESG